MNKPNIEWEHFIFERKNAKIEIIREIVTNNYDIEDLAY